MNLILNLLDGVGLMFDLPFERRRYTRSSGGFAKDSKAMAGDVRKIGRDLKKQIDKHGASKYHSH